MGGDVVKQNIVLLPIAVNNYCCLPFLGLSSGDTLFFLKKMTPEISEFSYGFALTNEIVGWAPTMAAPLFPSLIEEGKEGGGYDVKLELPAVALYLQFKRADCMVRATAREVSEHRLPINLPFYRFNITQAGKSDQHELLLALDEGGDLIFYAAPRFHELAEINDAWALNRIADRSIFISPSEIGRLDNKSHHVAYDYRRAWLCSNPKEVEFIVSEDLVRRIQNNLKRDLRPLHQKLLEFSESLESAKRIADERIARRKQQFKGLIRKLTDDQSIYHHEVRKTGIAIRPPRKLDIPEQILRDISDESAKTFNSQLIIMQPRE